MVHSFRLSSVDKISDADIVIIGIPDESKSHAKRKGTSTGPDVLRMASNESEFFERDGKIIPICPLRGSTDNKHILDYGNTNKEDLHQLIFDLVSAKKIPIVVGGDHSLTTIVLQAIGEVYDKIGMLYFDAHPDFVSSTTNYYGSVLTDSCKWIDFTRSLLIGTRAAEPEELENAEKVGLEVITPLDITEWGIWKTADKIRSKISKVKNMSQLILIVSILHLLLEFLYLPLVDYQVLTLSIL